MVYAIPMPHYYFMKEYASVAKRLGHANTTTTQETYIHIIEELENKDNDKVLHHLSQLN